MENDTEDFPTGMTFDEANRWLADHYYPAALDGDPEWVRDMIDALTAEARDE